jgi:hypothetical protein
MINQVSPEVCEFGLRDCLFGDDLMITFKDCRRNTTRAWIRTVSHGPLSLWY